MPTDVTLVVNTANPAVQSMKTANEEQRKLAAEQIYLLALMNYRQLTSEELDVFTANAAALLQNYLKN